MTLCSHFDNIFYMFRFINLMSGGIEMAEENHGEGTNIAVSDELDLDFAHSNRRYVGRKETLGYILNKWSGGFNIGKFDSRFIYDVLKIDFSYLAFLDGVGGIWDVFNDTVIGALVDKTRTRWGKFRPYLIGINIPMTFVGLLYWFMPYFFAGTDVRDLHKFAFYFFFKVITETTGTFTGISNTGLLSTITPVPSERTRLIMAAQLLAIGSNVPELLMGVLLDLVNKEILKWQLRNLFLGFGLTTSLVAAAASFYFFLHSKERVAQSIERPSIIQGLKSIATNKPILMITLSEFLEGFSLSTSMSDYYIDVLGSISLQTLVGVPGGLFTYSGYAFLPKMRRIFSTRALWIISDLWTDACWLGVCAIGLVNKNYTKVKVMVPTMMIEECIEMCMYAVRKVLPQELYNEAMDYCEWKNGYRTEAMTGVARGLITKLQRIVNNVIKNILMKKIGYEQGRKIGTQDDSTKMWMFAWSTGLPVLTGALGVLPKFLYPLTGAKRDLMYAELMKRREALATAASHATNEELEEIGHKQMRGDFDL